MSLRHLGPKAMIGLLRISAPALLGVLASCKGAALAPTAPALAPTVPAIGMNLTANAYWENNAPFLDRFKTAAAWIATDRNYKQMPPGTVPTDANGYPLAIPASVFNMTTNIALDPVSLPISHRYSLTYAGKADFRLPGVRIVSTKPGSITFDFARKDASIQQVTITSIDAHDPPHDIHVVRDDQQAQFAAGEVFNPAFLEKVRNWSTLRMMGWLNTNVSEPVDWAKRPTRDTMSWTEHGVPLEIMVRLANEAHTNLWLNIPTLADDAYVRSMATLVKAELDPRHKAYFEYSNEMWNWGFKAAHIAQHEGNRLWGKDANGDGKIDDANPAENYGPGWLTWYGYRSAQVASVVKHVFAGADRGRALTVISTQSTVPGREKPVFDGVTRAKLGSVADLFDAFAITTYFGHEFGMQRDGPELQTLLGWVHGGDAGLTAAFAQLEKGGALSSAMPLSQLPQIYAYWARISAANHLKLVAYEGGAHLTTGAIPADHRAEVVDFIKRLMNDPRMGKLYTQMIADFGAAGGSELLILSDVGEARPGGYWGVLDTIYQTSSPRYDAIKAAAARAHAAH